MNDFPPTAISRNSIRRNSIRRNSIQCILNGEALELRGFRPDALLLDYIREQKRLTGTKEGCAEGDCGACTVLVGHMRDGMLHYKSVNACIQFLASLDAKHIVTIEALADGSLKPLQDAMVKYHGSQCGFCTPGIMMSLFALFMNNIQPSENDIETALQGNLCRCTGYEPIIKAALSLKGDSACADWLDTQRKTISDQLSAFPHDQIIEICQGDQKAFVPKTLDQLAKCLSENPEATLVAGATDVGLWVAKQFRDINPAIFIHDIDALNTITHDQGISLGANVTYADALHHLKTYHAAFGPLIRRIGGAQVRNAGTIGGNIANGSPIGDMPPALIALNATLELKSVSGIRQIPLEDYFLDYGKQDLRAGECVQSLHLPPLTASQHVKFYKISKRRDEDISSVMAAFNLVIENGHIKEARIAFGGMAATPKRAVEAEKALIGKPMSEATMQAAAQCLPKDFTPLSDWRASAEYRMLVAQNLFVKYAADMADEAVSNAA